MTSSLSVWGTIALILSYSAYVAEVLRAAQIEACSTFNYTAHVVAALLFVALNLPLTRLTDHLQKRQAHRRGGGGGGR